MMNRENVLITRQKAMRLLELKASFRKRSNVLFFAITRVVAAFETCKLGHNYVF
jgi:hypothetical protein